jgi:gluconate 5-dehydrogenase
MGLAASRLFAREGDRVFLYDRDERRLADAVAAVAAEGVATGRAGDVRSRADVRAALDACEAELGPVDVCLNHAGIGPSTHTLALGDAEWDEVLSINLTGIFRVGQEVARRMAARRTGVI